MNENKGKSAPLISVIMGVYNQYNRKQLVCAVNSILIQTLKDFEFIIYDDGSDNEPAEFLQHLASTDRRIRIIREETNHGLAFSLNRCISEAKGKYLARMDADDISMPQRLMEEYCFLEEHPEYGWVGCNAYVFEHSRIWGVLRMAELPNQFNFLPFSPYIHPSVMFRKDVLEETSKYNISKETLRCEDYELFMRLYRQGERGYNLQRELLFYRQSSDSYKRRTMKNRIREMHIRARYFPQLNLPMSKCLIYTLRPVITGIIPYPMISCYKKWRLKERRKNDDGTEHIQADVGTYIDFLYRMGTAGGSGEKDKEVVFSGP